MRHAAREKPGQTRLKRGPFLIPYNLRKLNAERDFSLRCHVVKLLGWEIDAREREGIQCVA